MEFKDETITNVLKMLDTIVNNAKFSHSKLEQVLNSKGYIDSEEYRLIIVSLTQISEITDNILDHLDYIE